MSASAMQGGHNYYKTESMQYLQSHVPIDYKQTESSDVTG